MLSEGGDPTPRVTRPARKTQSDHPLRASVNLFSDNEKEVEVTKQREVYTSLGGKAQIRTPTRADGLKFVYDDSTPVPTPRPAKAHVDTSGFTISSKQEVQFRPSKVASLQRNTTNEVLQIGGALTVDKSLPTPELSKFKGTRMGKAPPPAPSAEIQPSPGLKKIDGVSTNTSKVFATADELAVETPRKSRSPGVNSHLAGASADNGVASPLYGVKGYLSSAGAEVSSSPTRATPLGSSPRASRPASAFFATAQRSPAPAPSPTPARYASRPASASTSVSSSAANFGWGGSFAN